MFLLISLVPVSLSLTQFFLRLLHYLSLFTRYFRHSVHVLSTAMFLCFYVFMQLFYEQTNMMTMMTTLPVCICMSVCLSVCLCVSLHVCLSDRISPEPHTRSLRNFVHVAYVRGSVLRQQGDEISTGRGNFGGFPPH